MSRHDVEAEFEAIAERCLQEMAKVEATVFEYQDGLKTLIHLAETTLQASREMDGSDE